MTLPLLDKQPTFPYLLVHHDKWGNQYYLVAREGDLIRACHSFMNRNPDFYDEADFAEIERLSKTYGPEGIIRFINSHCKRQYENIVVERFQCL